MRKVVFALVLGAGFFLLAGFRAVKPVSDVAQYGISSKESRIKSLLNAANDLFRRRRYEDAVRVYEIVLAINSSEISAKAGIVKARFEMSKEGHEREKQALYKKYGHLIPKEMIYPHWHWGPEVGHFEVRYSKPKPYVKPIRRVHKKASDAEIAQALAKAESSQNANDYFELSMRYWSRKMADKALNAYYKAIKADAEILSRDDELLLSTFAQNTDKQIAEGKANASDYLNSGKLLLIQGEAQKSLNRLTTAAIMGGNIAKEASDLVKTLILTPAIKNLSAPPEIFSFRQAYVFDKNAHKLYMKLSLTPKNEKLIIPLDLPLPVNGIKSVSCESKDVAMAFAMPGFGDYTRLWAVLNERKDRSPHEIRVVLNLLPKQISYLDLSNYTAENALSDNWSFIITSEFNQSANGTPNGEYNKSLNGIEIFGYNLAISEGRGPAISLNGFTQPLARAIDVWALIESGGERSLDSLF